MVWRVDYHGHEALPRPLARPNLEWQVKLLQGKNSVACSCQNQYRRRICIADGVKKGRQAHRKVTDHGAGSAS